MKVAPSSQTLRPVSSFYRVRRPIPERLTAGTWWRDHRNVRVLSGLSTMVWPGWEYPIETWSLEIRVPATVDVADLGHVVAGVADAFELRAWDVHDRPGPVELLIPVEFWCRYSPADLWCRYSPADPVEFDADGRPIVTDDR